MSVVTSPATSRGSRAHGWAIAALVVGTLAAYSNSLHGPFVYDDGPAILTNPTIHHLWPLAPVLRPLTEGGLTVSGRPVLNLSLALNYVASGDAPWSYHAFNLVIHLLAGLALFGVVRRTLRRMGPSIAPGFVAAGKSLATRTLANRGVESELLALVIAGIWLLHPVQTESVTYTVQRAESLMGLFFLLTLYAFIRAVDDTAAAGGESRPGKTRWRVLAIIACMLGMATKEVMATAPLLVFIYDRTFVAGTFRAAWRQHRGFYLGLASTWLLLGALVIGTGGNRGGTLGFGVDVPWWAYGLTQFQALARYLQLGVWPRTLIFEYGTFWVQRGTDILPYAAVVVPLLAATGFALWRWPRVGFCGAWFFGILAPTSLAPGTIQMIVEHRMYLSLAGIVALVTVGGYRWLGSRAIFCGAAVALIFGGLTFARNRDYRSHLDLWGDTVAKRPLNPRAHQGLAEAYAELGRSGEAIAHYAEAIRLQPAEWKYHYNLALTLAGVGRLDEAVRHYQLALRLSPDEPETHNNLAVALVKMVRPEAALPHYAAAARLRPNQPQFRYNLGVALLRAGRIADAIAEFQETLRLRPSDADAHFNLGSALVSSQSADEGLTHYVEALRLKPADAEYRTSYADALLIAGRADEAVAQFQSVLIAHPDTDVARFGLGNAFAALRRWDDAIGNYQALIGREPGHADARFKLGDAFVQTDRLPQAVREYETALRLRPDDAEGHHNLGIAFARLERWPEARREFETALRLKPNYPEALRHLEQLLPGLRP